MPESILHAYASILALRRLKAEVRLGVGQEERAKPQTVFIDVTLYFPQKPPAASSDHADYICYYGIGQKIHDLCQATEYRLIEYLVHEIHMLLRNLVPEPVKIGVKLRKPSIMLSYAEEGASYGYTDLPPGAWVAPE